MTTARPERAARLCPHFGECGGCQSQDVPYEEQVMAKAQALRGLFGAHWDGPISVTPSPAIWHYRNKVDPAFAPKRYDKAPPEGFVRDTVLGFKRKGRWFWPLDIRECRIGPAGLAKLLDAVRHWYRKEGLRAFDSRTKEGFLKVLLVRDAKRTGERMVVLITRGGSAEGGFNAGAFVDAVNGAFGAASIYRGIFHGDADVAAADELELLDGAPTITEHLYVPDGRGPRKVSFRISPFSFFQTNPLATERLYAIIRHWTRRTAPATLYDLYGGSGGIAFSCADLVSRVWSVESIAAASEDGRANAQQNSIENVTFVTQEVKKYLQQQAEAEGLAPASAVVLDPPRAGLHPKALKHLLRLAPGHVLYVSCNPKILARELPLFLEHYTINAMHAVDLFPHTRHVEVVAEMVRRAPA